MLKILQAGLQQYVNWELPDVQEGFRKDRGARDQIANISWIIEKAREFQKNSHYCFIDYAKAFDYVDHSKLKNSSRRWEFQTTCLSSQVSRSSTPPLLRNLYAGQGETELDMEQRTVSQLRKEYVKVVYCYPVYLTSMQSTLREMPGWMKCKLE